MAKKRQLAVIYVDNNKIQFFSKELKNILEIPLSAEVISDLEIVDSEKLAGLIDNFFQANNLKDQEFDCILVFSPNTTFSKDLEEGATKFKYDETQKFLDMVPFEDVLSNSYKIGKKTKVVATNKSFFDALRTDFEKNKAYISLVVPMAVLVEIYPDFSRNLNLSNIASKLESIKQYSLVGFSENYLQGEVKTSVGIKRKDIRLVGLLGVFVVLILVLIYMVYTTFFAVKPKTPVKPLPVKKTVVNNKEDVQKLASPSADIATPSSLLDASSSSETQ